MVQTVTPRYLLKCVRVWVLKYTRMHVQLSAGTGGVQHKLQQTVNYVLLLWNSNKTLSR